MIFSASSRGNTGPNNINFNFKKNIAENFARNLHMNDHEIQIIEKEDRNSSGENFKDVNPNLENENRFRLVDEDDTENDMKSQFGSSKKLFNVGPLNLNLFESKFEDNKENYTIFSKTKEIEFLYYQYLYNSFFQCVFSFTTIFCSILQYELEYSSFLDLNYLNDNPNSESIISISNWFCFITSIFLWIVIIYEHFINCRILFLRKNLPERLWRKKREQIWSLIFKLAMNFLHPCPFFIGIKLEFYNEKFEIYEVHSLNSIMTVFCLLRIWCIFKFYLIHSHYYSPRAQRICQMNNFDTGLQFSMKANMTVAPQNAYLILFLIILVYNSYCLRIFERVLDEVSGKTFSSFWTTFWCLIITMTTVGYGDNVPSSFLGRLIGICSCILGVFLISMLIVTISNLFELSPIEENVFQIIRRIKLTKEKDNIAAKFVTKYIKNLKNMKKNNHKAEKKIGDDLLLRIHYLKEKLVDIDDTFPHYSENDIVKDLLTRLEESVDGIKIMYDDLQLQVNQIKEMLTSTSVEGNDPC